MSERPRFFRTPAAFRKWLEKNHDKVDVQWVGFYKVGTGRPSINWNESVDEALCFGWIDGLRRSIDDEAYKIRFTPRRPGSNWSAKNIASVERLNAAGRMRTPGLREFESRKPEKSGDSIKHRDWLELSADYEKQFKKNKGAWKWFQEQAPSYKRTAAHWVMSAKKEETRERRFQRVVNDSAEQSTIPPLTRSKR